MSEVSLGELVASATKDLSALVRQEVELAKLEIKRDVVLAGKGAGLLGGAGAMAALGGLFVCIAAAYALNLVVPTWVSFLIVGVVFLLLAGVLGLKGKKSLTKLSPPQRTIETVKDDLAWAKHPTVAPTRKLDEAVRS